jgi:hypothetical protein
MGRKKREWLGKRITGGIESRERMVVRRGIA